MSTLGIPSKNNDGAPFGAKSQSLNKDNVHSNHLFSLHQNIDESDKNTEKTAYMQAKFTGPSFSNETKTALLEQQEVSKPIEPRQSVIMDTGEGKTELSVDDYFADKPSVQTRLLDTPLLVPSAKNIEILSKHASSRFKQMLEDHGIPSPPDTIRYGRNGAMILPENYPYADKLKQALEENPGLDRELRTVNALTSHYVELQKLKPLHEGLAAAKSQAEIDKVIAKYNHLLAGNRTNSTIALRFSNDGILEPFANGKPVQLAT